MYEAYFGLREKAFRKTPDPRYLFLNETYEEALARLLFAVEEREIGLLTGEIGSGKTLLSRVLVDRLGDGWEVAMIVNPRLSPRQLLKAVARELDIAEPAAHAADLVDQLQARLFELDQAGRAVLLIIDEAHLVPSRATFEELRLLTNVQLDDRSLLALILLGQTELRRRLKHRTYRALTQRLGADFHLGTFSPQDTAAYVRHRLAVAGGRRDDIFTDEALARLHQASGGVPRVLNHLATQCLLEVMALGGSQVTADVAQAVVSSLDFVEEGH